MNYCLSEGIQVYPCAFRGNKTETKVFNPEARLNSEYNIVHSRQGRKSFIVDYKISENSAGTLRWISELYVYIGGYYFEIKNPSTDDSTYFSAPGAYTLSIRVNKAVNSTSEEVLASFESGSSVLDVNKSNNYVFTGLAITTAGEQAEDATDSLTFTIDKNGNINTKATTSVNGSDVYYDPKNSPEEEKTITEKIKELENNYNSFIENSGLTVENFVLSWSAK